VQLCADSEMIEKHLTFVIFFMNCDINIIVLVYTDINIY